MLQLAGEHNVVMDDLSLLLILMKLYRFPRHIFWLLSQTCISTIVTSGCSHYGVHVPFRVSRSEDTELHST